MIIIRDNDYSTVLCWSGISYKFSSSFPYLSPLSSDTNSVINSNISCSSIDVSNEFVVFLY